MTTTDIVVGSIFIIFYGVLAFLTVYAFIAWQVNTIKDMIKDRKSSNTKENERSVEHRRLPDKDDWE